MKKFIFLALMIAISSIAYGQNIIPSAEDVWKSNQIDALFQNEKTTMVFWLDSTHLSDWDTGTSTWIFNEIDYYVYDPVGNQIEDSTIYYDDILFTWVPDGKTKTLFSPINLPIQRNHWTWDEVNTEWDNSTRNIYTHNNIDQLTETLHQFWNTGLVDWGNSTKTTNEYNSQNKIQKNHFYNWNGGGSYWTLSQVVDFYYNSFGNPTSIYNYIIDNITYVQELSYKIELSYDIDQYLIEYLYLGWNDNQSIFFPLYKVEYNNDATGNKLIEILSMWNSGTNDWDSMFKYTYTYDINNNLTEKFYYEFNSPNWDPIYRSQYFYTNMTSVSELEDPLTFHLFPNPASETLTIEFYNSPSELESISIFNSIGEKVITTSDINQSTSIDISQLPQGLYLLKTSENKQGCSFIKQ